MQVTKRADIAWQVCSPPQQGETLQVPLAGATAQEGAVPLEVPSVPKEILPRCNGEGWGPSSFYTLPPHFKGIKEMAAGF